MYYAVVIAAVGLMLTMVGLFIYREVWRRREPPGGFRQWVKDPSYRKFSEVQSAARKALVVPDDISDDEIRQMVDRLFVRNDLDFNFDRLKLLGARAVPFLVEALERAETATAHFGRDDTGLVSESPQERICRLLEPFGPPEAVDPLVGFMDHEDEHFREQAAFALGNIGTSKCIAPLQAVLADDNEHVQAFAMMGIERAIKANRSSPEFLDAIFPAIERLLGGDDNDPRRVPRLLLAIDADRAIPILMSTEHFTTANGRLHGILSAINEAGYMIPHDKLLPLMDELAPRADKYPRDYQYGEALQAYAHNPDAAAEATFRKALSASSERARESAAQSLAILAGVGHARDMVCDVVNAHGAGALSQEQLFYYAVCLYDAEVNNGGHAQYFVNSYSDLWKSALTGLESIGARERAGILREAVALFGNDGPPENRDARHDQLARFSPRKDKALDGLDNRYYACQENVAVLLALYAIENKSQFVRKPFAF